MGKFIVVTSDGREQAHSCYYPAEQQAKSIEYAKVIYRGVRGLEVQVWPLPGWAPESISAGSSA